MFVITKHVTAGGHYYLSPGELSRMRRSGRWEIASHGNNDHDVYRISAGGEEGHFMSNLLWLQDEQRLETPEEFRRRIHLDLLAAKQELEQTFGITVSAYAYPFGDYGQGTTNFPGVARVIAEVVESIYPLAFYQAWNEEVGNVPDPDAFMVKRIRVSPAWNGADLLNIIEGEKL